MAAKYILAALSALFLVLGTLGVIGGGGRLQSKHRTWLMVGAIFAAVSAWLFTRE